MTLALVLLAAALGLAGTGAQRGDGAPRGTWPVAGPERAPVPAVTLQVVTAVAVGAACLCVLPLATAVVAGPVAAALGAVAVRWLSARPGRARPGVALALALDLVAVALRSGQPLAAALVLAGPAAGGPCGERLARVGALLRLGADPVEAWGVVAADHELAPVAAAGVRSAASGLRLAAAFEQLAVDVRAEVRAEAVARAQRAEVFAAAPLGLCFLPSFVCLGIVPTVVGIVGAALPATVG